MNDVDMVLDIGCGFRPQPFIDAAIHICCEPFDEYLHRLIIETAGVGKYVYLKCDFQTAVQIFPPGSVDSVFLVDVIEHLERKVVLKCLQKALTIAKSQVVVFTPLGFMPQKSLPGNRDQWGMAGGAYQEHISGWHPEDFPASQGWKVIACKEFHQQDAHGKKLGLPIGAIWAIKDIKVESKEYAK